MDANAVSAALESVLARGSTPSEDYEGPYIFTWRDNDVVVDATVFDAARFAIHNPEGYANWIMGKPDREINPPHPSDREAIKLLPQRLQKRIRNYEKQRKNEETDEISEP
jgi:hypothetical protein